MQSGPPSDGDNLLGMEFDFVAYLGGLDAVDEASVSVRRTAQAETLLLVECAAAAGVSLRDAAEAVREAWLGPLRYHFHEAHHLSVSETQAVLRFITQIGPSDFYVTGQVTVRGANPR